jgi:hypothetical protein
VAQPVAGRFAQQTSTANILAKPHLEEGPVTDDRPSFSLTDLPDAFVSVINRTMAFHRLIFAALVVSSGVFAQGNLAPPGPPAPTMKTLDQIEPRTPISALPFTINRPGSYYLTTNLTGVSGQSGILVLARNVTIDLNGFELVGVPGASSGIFASVGITNLAVRNGTIRNWPVYGLGGASATQGRYENLSLLYNGSGGLTAGLGSIIADCNFQDNGTGSSTSSLQTGAANQIRHCTVRGGNGDGIRAGYGSTISDCAIEQSGANGLFTDESCTVRGCTVTLAGLAGIDAGPGNTIDGSTSGFNGDAGIVAGEGATIKTSTSYNNGAEGIVSSRGSLVESCSVRMNGLSGISIGRDGVIANCTVSTNAGHGIRGTTNVVVRSCVVTRSTLNGIQLDDNSVIANCTSSLNRSNGLDVAVGCTVTESVANGNSRFGVVANARCRVVGTTANNNGSFMTSGAGFLLLGDDNHLEGNNSVHNFIGYIIYGAFNFIVKNKASDFFNAGFSLDAASNREAPIVNDPTAAQPWSNFAF